MSYIEPYPPLSSEREPVEVTLKCLLIYVPIFSELTIHDETLTFSRFMLEIVTLM